MSRTQKRVAPGRRKGPSPLIIKQLDSSSNEKLWLQGVDGFGKKEEWKSAAARFFGQGGALAWRSGKTVA